ncbi:hypothetical protein AVEN_260481-1 [Araneus ventricosus]|uniref:Uncharacterized protein n=1 Tax=Araneus ventricosus TaxID=182803 RepID=A0A4Y2LS01_ARAVE|nr:hypothetical protein AVEN_260481-1 [Araneus ventricosus]
MKCGRSLQWAVCLLHANELPLRHLLQTLYGVTSDPRVFSGPIGIAIKTCEELAIVPFEAIERSPLSEMGNSIYVTSVMTKASVREHSMFEKTTDHEVENSVKKWLVYAKDREGGRSH